MSYEDEAHKLEHSLSRIPGVRYAALQWPAPGQLEVGVVLEASDFDVRGKVIESIDDFHRSHVHELSVDFDIVDVEHAGQLFVDA